MNSLSGRPFSSHDQCLCRVDGLAKSVKNADPRLSLILQRFPHIDELREDHGLEEVGSAQRYGSTAANTLLTHESVRTRIGRGRTQVRRTENRLPASTNSDQTGCSRTAPYRPSATFNPKVPGPSPGRPTPKRFGVRYGCEDGNAARKKSIMLPDATERAFSSPKRSMSGSTRCR
jgi:hypothetical protein